MEIETLTFPGHIWDPFMPARSEATPATVTAVLAVPTSSFVVPAVVITHGCGGLGESGVTAGYDAGAAAQAKIDVTTFLEEALNPSSP